MTSQYTPRTLPAPLGKPRTAWDLSQPSPEPEPSTAAVRDGRPLVHSHVGQQQPHVHTAETLRDHRRPIVGERVYSRLPEPGSAPATWHDGPYEAASVLRRWAEQLGVTESMGRADCARLARDLLGAASVLDGSVTA